MLLFAMLHLVWAAPSGCGQKRFNFGFSFGLDDFVGPIAAIDVTLRCKVRQSGLWLALILTTLQRLTERLQVEWKFVFHDAPRYLASARAGRGAGYYGLTALLRNADMERTRAKSRVCVSGDWNVSAR
jgi:hypothetical protein